MVDRSCLPVDDPILAAGVLLMVREEPRQFLLMRHTDRWDLPKGHVEPGETPREAALREMGEETGIPRGCVDLDQEFEYVIEYWVRYPDHPVPRLKRVYYFLGWIDHPRPILCTEHEGSSWIDWTPPHKVQEQTIDPLLDSVEKFLD